MCLLQEYIRGKDFLLDSRKTLECSSLGCALPILPGGITGSTRSSLGPAITWGGDPGWKGGWREKVEVMGVLERKKSHREFVECLFHFHEMEKKNNNHRPLHTHLFGISATAKLKHNKNFSLKGEHKY